MPETGHQDRGLSTDVRSIRTLTSAAASAIVRAAIDGGPPVSVAVVDAAGDLLAFERADGAPAFSARLALSKAVTAAAFGRPTADMEPLFEGRPGFAAGFLAQGPWFVARGGAPIVVDGECVGAVGVSGASAEHEDALARRLAAG